MSPRELVPGSIVGGKYAVRSVLGKTPVAVTYHAFTAPNREVALKLYDPSLAQRPDVIAALGSAAAAARDLPGHLALEELDDGVDPELGAPFRVTELSSLPPLSQLVSLCPLTPDEARQMLGSLAAALDLVHQRGHAHLDLKPNNVFVGPPPRYAVRLGDFGAGFTTATERTPWQLAWAAPWLAPEQLDGEGSSRSDVMTCALLAFYAMTGKSYWRSCAGDVDLASWRDELVAPRTLASVRAHELRVVVPPALDAAFTRALAHDPAARFASVGELVAALDGRTLPSLRAPSLRAPAIAVEAAGEDAAASTSDPFPSSRVPLAAAQPIEEPPPPRISTRPAPAQRRRIPPVLVLAPVGALAVLVALAAVLRTGPFKSSPAPTTTQPAPIPTREPPAASAPDAQLPAPPPTQKDTPAATPPSPTAQPTDGTGLEITCVPECVLVKIDDTEITIRNALIPLAAGPHTILVEASNHRRKLLSINLKAGRVEKMFFQLGVAKRK